MKTFTYVAAIALLTAGTAFAQAQSGSAGANGSTINNSTPTPAAKGAAEGAPHTSTGPGATMNQSGSGMNRSGSMSMDKSSGSMDQSSNMHHSRAKASKSASKAKSHHVARNDRSVDARENEETMRLNRQQLASGGSAGMQNGYDQTAQSPNERGMPATPTQTNPAINSVPQARTYNNSQR